MEDEFLLFVIASFVEKFFIFFRISRIVVYSFFFLLFVENGRREIRDLISYHFVFFSLSS